MRLPRPLAAALLAAVLCGCASNPRLREVREFAAESSRLGGYADLTQRFRETYPRLRPYLSPGADQRERAADAQRRAAHADFMAIHDTLALYLRTLAALADGERFSLDRPLQELGAGVKALPGTGLTDRHVNAHVGLTRLLARAFTEPYQERAARAMVRDGGEQVAALLEAMQLLLRYYDGSSDNERDMVLGMLDVEIPYADTPRERLLAALAKSHRQAKASEYRLIGLRHTLAAKHVAAVADAHRTLLAHLDRPADAGARVAVAGAHRHLRGAALALEPSIATGELP
ncbi:hypothetical protein [Pseudoduganella namucuonensis]|uniref:Lipoprotein n=1 Tax=Pseudoduganella namucuonensis TaxID=1035707 RepID=A0A1I7J5Z2_9BURK|nr:hypothetical protein [Pseudoduganella namucuonensis]SFU80567.1 hypothetical protein SAMN05216552_101086 [Pseudoduganella namucuonensis]